MTTSDRRATDVPLSVWHGPSTTHGGDAYGEMISTLRRFLATVAEARPPEALVGEVSATLAELTGRLRQHVVDEFDQVYARRSDLVGRGQATWPLIVFTACDDCSLAASVRFDRFFLGRNGVVHGGAIMLVFDEVAGRLAHVGDRPVARTAFLRTDFRAPALIDVDLRITARLMRQEGRKRFLTLQLYQGDVLCAEAEALMVELKPGQR